MQTPYHKFVLSTIPRILTNLDRDSSSPTYGCFDRNFWHYKIRDFASAILQQCVLTLVLIYKNNFEGNIYYKKKKIKEYAIAAVDYWVKIQHRDGSFNEYFWMEHSIPSTAFSLYAICETCKILNYLPKKVLNAMRKTVKFLKKNPEEEALNQEIAAIAAIEFVGKITNDKKIENIAKKKFETILNKMNAEGWFQEYGGLDVGYLTVSLDYLIRYYELSKDKRVISSAKKIINFLKYFIHPDGSLGGEYGTRNTEYFLPYGFEYMKKHEPICYKIVDKLCSYINQLKYINIPIDERYILHYLSHSFVKALLIYNNKKSNIKLPYEKSFSKLFEESKIVIHSTDSYYFICSILKGGVFKVINKKGYTATTDCGYKIFCKNNIYVSEWPNNKNSFTVENNFLEITSNFKKVKYIVQDPIKLNLIKILSPVFGVKIINILKKKLIFGDKKYSSMKLERCLKLKNKKIITEDSIYCNNKKAVVKECDGLSMRYVPSSKFFQINSIDNQIKGNSYPIDSYKKVKKEISF